jgi:hypothetical protein
VQRQVKIDKVQGDLEVEQVKNQALLTKRKDSEIGREDTVSFSEHRFCDQVSTLDA